jgi:hypothetical protein
VPPALSLHALCGVLDLVTCALRVIQMGTEPRYATGPPFLFLFRVAAAFLRARTHTPTFQRPHDCTKGHRSRLGCASLACLKGVPRAVQNSPVRSGCVESAHLPERRVCVRRRPCATVSSGAQQRTRSERVCMAMSLSPPAALCGGYRRGPPYLSSPRAPSPRALTPPRITS